jgi:hypothetical protein
MGKRCDLVKAYIEALGLCPVMVLSGSNVAKIATGPEPDFDVFDTLWFGKPQHAELVLMHLPKRSGPGAAALLESVVNTAAILGAKWQTGAEIEAQASNAVEEIVARVEGWRLSGGLAKVNAAYKIYRQNQIAKGEAAITYTAHIEAFTRSLVVLAAQNSIAQ